MAYTGTDQHLIVFSGEMTDFVKTVQSQIDIGYKPQGGLLIHNLRDGGIFYYQAMYRPKATVAKEAD